MITANTIQAAEFVFYFSWILRQKSVHFSAFANIMNQIGAMCNRETKSTWTFLWNSIENVTTHFLLLLVLVRHSRCLMTGESWSTRKQCFCLRKWQNFANLRRKFDRMVGCLRFFTLSCGHGNTHGTLFQIRQIYSITVHLWENPGEFASERN